MWMGVGNRFARPQAGGGVGALGPAIDLNFLASTLDSRLTFGRATVATDSIYTDASGSGFNSFSSGVPRISIAKGLWLEAATTNFLLNSGAPVTQTTGSLSVAAYTLWVVGTGSAALTAGTATVTGAGTATPGTPLLFNVTVAGTVTVTVTGSLTRFQLENSAVPTSYISTTGATASRAAESCSMPVGSWFSSVNGSLLAEVNYVFAPTAANSIIVDINDNSINNRVALSVTTAKHTQGSCINAGVSGSASTVNTWTNNSTFRTGMSYGPLGSVAAQSGQVSGKVALPAGGVPAGIVTLKVGSTSGNSNFGNGFTRRIRYFNRELSSSELAQYST